MEQGKSKLRYESYGIPEKQKNLVKKLAIVILLCGIFLIVIASKLYGSMEETYRWIGIAATAGGLLLRCFPTMFMKKYENAMLKVYEDKVEGMSFAPDDYFTLKYEEIYDVKKTSLAGWNMLVIESERNRYVAVVEDADTAYFIINKKLDELEKVD